MRALIHIDSPAAPERYDFPVGGDVTSLRLTIGGAVDALNSDGDVIARAAAPWAFDANGAAVPTHYEVSGTVLTQVVEHRAGHFAYGVVADPSFIWWAVTTATCGVQIASFLVPGKLAQVGAKLARAAKHDKSAKKAVGIIHDMGGLKKAGKKVLKYVKSRGKDLSKTQRKQVEGLIGLGKDVFSSLLGIGSCGAIVKELL